MLEKGCTKEQIVTYLKHKYPPRRIEAHLDENSGTDGYFKLRGDGYHHTKK